MEKIDTTEEKVSSVSEFYGITSPEEEHRIVGSSIAAILLELSISRKLKGFTEGRTAIKVLSKYWADSKSAFASSMFYLGISTGKYAADAPVNFDKMILNDLLADADREVPTYLVPEEFSNLVDWCLKKSEESQEEDDKEKNLKEIAHKRVVALETGESDETDEDFDEQSSTEPGYDPRKG